MESGGPAGPEFDAIGDQAIPKPVVWTSDCLVGEFLLEYLKLPFQFAFIPQWLRLLRCPGSDLTFAGRVDQ